MRGTSHPNDQDVYDQCTRDGKRIAELERQLEDTKCIGGNYVKDKAPHLFCSRYRDPDEKIALLRAELQKLKAELATKHPMLNKTCIRCGNVHQDMEDCCGCCLEYIDRSMSNLLALEIKRRVQMYDSYQAEKANLQADLDRQAKEYDFSEARSEKLIAEIDKLKAELAELRSDDVVGNLCEQVETQKGEIAERDRAIQDLAADVSRLNAENTGLRRELRRDADDKSRVWEIAR